MISLSSLPALLRRRITALVHRPHPRNQLTTHEPSPHILSLITALRQLIRKVLHPHDVHVVRRAHPAPECDGAVRPAHRSLFSTARTTGSTTPFPLPADRLALFLFQAWKRVCSRGEPGGQELQGCLAIKELPVRQPGSEGANDCCAIYR